MTNLSTPAEHLKNTGKNTQVEDITSVLSAKNSRKVTQGDMNNIIHIDGSACKGRIIWISKIPVLRKRKKTSSFHITMWHTLLLLLLLLLLNYTTTSTHFLICMSAGVPLEIIKKMAHLHIQYGRQMAEICFKKQIFQTAVTNC